MSKIPTISVVVPLYNKFSTIIRCLDSVLNQSRKPDEIIVVNDGSTDSSEELVYSMFGDSVKLINQNNSGVSSARNTGINAATSDYIAFLDGDDYWSSQFIERIEQELIELPDIDVVAVNYMYVENETQYCSGTLYDESTRGKSYNIDDYFKWCVEARLPITSSSVCIRKKKLLNVGLFPVGVAMGEDQMTWIALSYNSNMRFINEVHAFYDIDVEGAATLRISTAQDLPHLVKLKEDLENGFVPDRLESYAKRFLHKGYAYSAYSALLIKNKRLAFDLLTKAGSITNRYSIKIILTMLIPYGILKIIDSKRER